EQMLKTVRDEVFPHFRDLGDSDSTFAEYMTDAQLLIQKPSLLVSAVNMIDALPLTEGDTKGDLYEYLLGKLTTAGINGQFRTPPAHHSADGRYDRAEAQRGRRRSGLRHGRFPRRRHAAFARKVHVAARRHHA